MRWLAKLWLLEGCDPSIDDREARVKGVKVHELDLYNFGETEADLDAEAFVFAIDMSQQREQQKQQVAHR